MNDIRSYNKARRIWTATQQDIARQAKSANERKVMLQVASATIHRNIDELERLEREDAYVIGDCKANAPGAGRWPYV